MVTQKVTLKVQVDVLDIESAKALLQEVMDQLDNETEMGLVQKRDGDKVQWTTSRKDVVI